MKPRNMTLSRESSEQQDLWARMAPGALCAPQNHTTHEPNVEQPPLHETTDLLFRMLP
jgi:hypothetical protein